MNHRHQLSTTAAADGLQLGSGLRRIVCLAALLFIFVAGVRAQYPITETAFPDKNFYKVVLEKYSMSNGANFLTNPGVTYMDVKSLTIRDLTGIGLFPLLQTLDCSNNQLRSADLQYNVYLTTVTIYKNRLYGTGMDKFIENLFDRSQQPTKGELRIIYNEHASTGNKMTSAQVEAAKKRGWTPKMSTNGTTWTDYPGSDAIAINATNFPDANFRNWLLEQSYGKDGYLSTPEIAAVTKIDVSYEGISSLKGIEYFTALKSLDCHYNKLTSLNVSKNTALTNLDCCHNQLTSLDVSNNTALKELYCYYNQLTSLNVLNNTAMTNLECNHNELTSLNVSQNKMLKTLGCEENKLTSLDVSACTALETLLCHDNQLTSLNVSKNTEMETLRCFGNQLTSLNVSNCTALTELNCVRNNLASLDVSNNTALTNLTCTNNKLTSLNVSNNTALTGLYCGSNQLTSLNVSKNTELTNLTCSNNQLTALDLSQNTVLTDLRCYSNELTSLDVTKCTALINLFCYKNMIRGAAMTNLVKSLPDIETGTLWVHYDETPEGNMMTPKQVKVATDKNWSVLSYDHGLINYEGEAADGIEISEENFPDDNFREYVGSKTIDKDEDGYLSDDEIAAVTKIDVSWKSISDLTGIEYFTALTELNCRANELTELDMSGFTALTELDCSQNKLTSLDASKNTALTNLECQGNQLTSLNVSGCTALEKLYCGFNELTSLDVSGCTALTVLDCIGDQLTSLDVSGCTALEKMYCYSNQLTSLDVSSCTALTVLDCFNNQIRGAAMTELVNNLPVRSASEKGSLMVYFNETPEGNMITTKQVEIATRKYWNVQMWDDYFGWIPYEGEIIPGDANGDGEVNALDIDCLRDYILGLDPQPFSFESADLDESGTVDIADLTRLIQLLTE